MQEPRRLVEAASKPSNPPSRLLRLVDWRWSSTLSRVPPAVSLAGERGLEVGVVADADQDGEEEDEGEVGEQKEKVGDKEHVQHVLLDPNHDSEKGELFGEIFEEVQRLADQLNTAGGFCSSGRARD